MSKHIDALIAEKVMGWNLVTNCGPYEHWHDGAECLGTHTNREFSTDPAASAQLKERMRELGWSVRVEAGPTGHTKAFFWKAMNVHSAQDDSERMALVLAALKTVGEDVEKGRQ